jgi:hypothetical protein
MISSSETTFLPASSYNSSLLSNSPLSPPSSPWGGGLAPINSKTPFISLNAISSISSIFGFRFLSFIVIRHFIVAAFHGSAFASSSRTQQPWRHYRHRHSNFLIPTLIFIFVFEIVLILDVDFTSWSLPRSQATELALRVLAQRVANAVAVAVAVVLVPGPAGLPDSAAAQGQAEPGRREAHHSKPKEGDQGRGAD